MRVLKRLKLFLSFSLLLSVTPGTRVWAEYIPPDQTSLHTERYVPRVRNYAEGKYRYQVAWQGVPVGKAEVEIKRSQVGGRPFLIVQARAKTESVIDVFYHLRHTTESMFDALSLEPLSYYSFQVENRRAKLLQMRFDQDGGIDVDQWKNGELKETHSFNLHNQTFDPISAAFLSRSLPLKIGSKLSLDVFNGKNRYLVELEVVASEVLRIKNQQRAAFKVVPTVKKLTDSEGENRLSWATLWVSADEQRDVLKLESEVKVGRVTATLD